MTVDEAINKINRVVDEMPTIVGNEAVNFYKDNFKKQGWQGESFQPWPKRKKETPKSRGKPILKNSGALERSIQVKESNQDGVTVGTGGQIPYARIQNEGGDINQSARSETFTRKRYRKGENKGRFKKGTNPNRKGFTFKARVIHIPQRQFMGDSPILRKQLNQAGIDAINKALDKG